jgi:ABC-type transport system involved in multi-copper enzyme maturation permease subunit
VLDIGLASISLFAVVIAVFLGSSLLYKEMERKTLYVILPKPIRRYEFLLGKYFGIALTGAVFVALMGSIQLWVVALQAGAGVTSALFVLAALLGLLGLAIFKLRDRTSVLVPWAGLALGASAWLCSTAHVSLSPLLAALVLIVGEVCILAAVALLFSSFSTPFLTGAFTLGVWLVGRAADDMVTMKSKAIGPAVKTLLRGVAEVAPNLNLYVPGRSTLTTSAESMGGPWVYVASALGYAAVYSAVVLALGALIFRRRDFL